MIALYCDSHAALPETITLDIDDTFDAAQSYRQPAFWNGFHGFAPIPVHEAESARPLAVVLRPARTPSGVETRAPVRRPIRRIRCHWPETRILLRGDGHYARPALMAWCEDNGVDFLFGLPSCCGTTRCSPRQRTPARCSGPRRICPCTGPIARRPMPPKAGGGLKRRTIARINATTLAMDIRALVTSLTGSTPERL